MAFSTGELDLESYLAQGGIKIHAGQLVRLLNVPITQAKSYHAFSDGKAHADHLNLASKQHYGVVGREWIQWLSIAENRQNLTAIYESVRHKWLNRLPDEASPQVQRVASRFVILETALIASLHLTGWQAEECSEAITKAFNEWINIFGLHSREEKTVIEQVNGWLLANAEGRFISVPFDSNQKISNIAGYRMLLTDNNHKEHFYVYPLAFDEAIKGLAKEQACQILLNADMLKQGREQGYKYMTKLPHKIDQKRTRCYLLYPITEPDTND
ncbi:Superfamily II helicase and inactivated derivatives [Mannheimia haemolytica]|nr:Superfamily II helicase and inactivated derivatives [Mannheimia haemolytica]